MALGEDRVISGTRAGRTMWITRDAQESFWKRCITYFLRFYASIRALALNNGSTSKVCKQTSNPQLRQFPNRKVTAGNVKDDTDSFEYAVGRYHGIIRHILFKYGELKELLAWIWTCWQIEVFITCWLKDMFKFISLNPLKNKSFAFGTILLFTLELAIFEIFHMSNYSLNVNHIRKV